MIEFSPVECFVYLVEESIFEYLTRVLIQYCFLQVLILLFTFGKKVDQLQDFSFIID